MASYCMTISFDPLQKKHEIHGWKNKHQWCIPASYIRCSLALELEYRSLLAKFRTTLAKSTHQNIIVIIMATPLPSRSKVSGNMKNIHCHDTIPIKNLVKIRYNSGPLFRVYFLPSLHEDLCTRTCNTLAKSSGQMPSTVYQRLQVLKTLSSSCVVVVFHLVGGTSVWSGGDTRLKTTITPMLDRVFRACSLE